MMPIKKGKKIELWRSLQQMNVSHATYITFLTLMKCFWKQTFEP
jgi:hypothetical protein